MMTTINAEGRVADADRARFGRDRHTARRATVASRSARSHWWLESRTGMTPLDLVTLTPLMDHTVGSREIVVGLIDGPVALSHPDLAGARIHEVPGGLAGTCERASSAACRHGTFVAGILAAARI